MVLLDTSPLLWTLADPDTLSTQGLLTIPDPVTWPYYAQTADVRRRELKPA